MNCLASANDMRAMTEIHKGTQLTLMGAVLVPFQTWNVGAVCVPFQTWNVGAVRVPFQTWNVGAAAHIHQLQAAFEAAITATKVVRVGGKEEVGERGGGGKRRWGEEEGGERREGGEEMERT